MKTSFRNKLDIFFFAIAIIALLATPVAIYFKYIRSNDEINLIFQGLGWAGFTVFTIMYMRKYFRREKIAK